MENKINKSLTLKRLWYLSIKNLKTMLRDRNQLVWLIGYPILFMVLYKVALGVDVYDFMAPALIIIGPTVIISQLAAHFAEEKELGTLQRLITTPASRSIILLSGLFSQLIVAAVQIIILILASLLLGAKFDPNVNIILLFFIPFLLAFTSLGFGLLLASFVKTAGSAGGLAWVIILPLQFLGGIFAHPPIIEFLPTTLAVEALRSVMTNGIATFDAIGLNLIFVGVWGVIAIIIGILLFQRKTAIL